MNKEQAIEDLIQLRWAIDSLPPDCEVHSISGSTFASGPMVHVDHRSVNEELSQVRTKRQDMDRVRRFRTVGTVEVFCLVTSPVPEGI